MSRALSSETRELLLAAAKRQFASKGFYGASIAGIAEELQLTKQALLHHFGSKEKLYGEVLQLISDQLSSDISQARARESAPLDQCVGALLAFYTSALEGTDSTQLLMRELLDNKRRAEHAGNWYLKSFLDTLAAMVKSVPGREDMSDSDALILVFQLLGAVNYFLISAPTLQRMFGKANYGRMKKRYPEELERLARSHLEVPSKRGGRKGVRSSMERRS